MSAATYYDKHSQELTAVVSSFDENEGMIIETIDEFQQQLLLKDVEMKINLIFIDSTFSILASAIGKLEKRGLQISVNV